MGNKKALCSLEAEVLAPWWTPTLQNLSIGLPWDWQPHTQPTCPTARTHTQKPRPHPYSNLCKPPHEQDPPLLSLYQGRHTSATQMGPHMSPHILQGDPHMSPHSLQG